jgi:hypothetical protein
MATLTLGWPLAMGVPTGPFNPTLVFASDSNTAFRQILAGSPLRPDAGLDAIPLDIDSGCRDGANGGFRDLGSNAVAGNQSNAVRHIS